VAREHLRRTTRSPAVLSLDTLLRTYHTPPCATVAPVEFTHRHRYATPKRAPQTTHIEVYSPDEVLFAGARWNLRTTKKGPRFNGFLPGPDGALLRIADSKLPSVRAGQQDVEVPYFPDPSQVVRVRHRLVGSRDHRAPYVVVDSRTGVEEGSPQQRDVVLLVRQRHIEPAIDLAREPIAPGRTGIIGSLDRR